MSEEKAQNPIPESASAQSENDIKAKSKKGIIIASVTGGVLVALLAIVLTVGNILLRRPQTPYSGIWYKSTAGFYDENGNALSDAGSFSFQKIDNGGSPYFELTGINLRKSGVKNIVLPVRSQDEEQNVYFVRSVSSFSSDNLFGATDYDDSIIGVYGESFYQKIGAYSFGNLKNLTTLEFGSPSSSSTSSEGETAVIEDFAFANDPALKTLHFSNATKTAGQGICANDGALEKVDFSSTLLTTLGKQAIGTEAAYIGAFENCTLLKSVFLPSTLQALGDHSFHECPALANISFNGTKNGFGKATKNAFEYCDSTLRSITCTDGVIAL